jgi:type I restriction enzyme S subunit
MISEWKLKTLQDLSTVLSRGITPSYVEMGGVRVLNQKCVRDQTLNFDSSRRTDTSKKAIHPDKLLQINDILVNSTGEGTLGRVAQIRKVTEPTTADSHITILRPNRDEVDPLFLGCVVRHLQPEIEKMAEGSTGQTELSRARLGALEINLPPRREQEKISSIIRNFDEKIESNWQMNSLLMGIARAVFQSWFIDFDPVRAKLDGSKPIYTTQAIANLFPDKFSHFENDVIPHGWLFTTIDELCGINTNTLSKNDPFTSLEYVEISEVSLGNISTISKYERGEEPSRARRKLSHGDTVLSTVRPDRGSYFLSLDPPSNRVASTGFAVISPTKVPWSYIHVALTQPEIFYHLGQMADGGAYPAVRPEVIGSIKIILPENKTLLTEFHNICGPLLEKAESNRIQSRTLAGLRDTLLPKLLSGELSVENLQP